MKSIKKKEDSMDIKNNWEEILKWGTENEKNRANAIKAASRLIFILTDTSGKHLSKDELKKMVGGTGCIAIASF
jgi:hypothetical protein